MQELLRLLDVTAEEFAAKWARLSAIDDALTSAGVEPQQLGALLEYAQPVFAINQLDATIKALQDKKNAEMTAMDSQIEARRQEKEALEKALRAGMA